MKIYYWVVILSLVSILLSCKSDQPKKLSGEIETIDLDYIQWACDCARFVEIQYLQEDLDEDELAEKCIFIEPSTLVEDILDTYYMDEYHHKYLRLTGQFYLDEGIPSSYEQQTNQKPSYARVFRYDKVEYVEK